MSSLPGRRWAKSNRTPVLVRASARSSGGPPNSFRTSPVEYAFAPCPKRARVSVSGKAIRDFLCAGFCFETGLPARDTIFRRGGREAVAMPAFGCGGILALRERLRPASAAKPQRSNCSHWRFVRRRNRREHPEGNGGTLVSTRCRVPGLRLCG